MRKNGLLTEFQFPSNGKAYHKWGNSFVENTLTEVSIPFKRESVSQASRLKWAHSPKRLFQFPSNGKAYHKVLGIDPGIAHTGRFNSLQTGKRITRMNLWQYLLCIDQFQFPSNGKAYHKVAAAKEHYINTLSFNSLQTGKRITSANVRPRGQGGVSQFQFPSNGKAYHKAERLGRKWIGIDVSIPFKRESVSQVKIHDAFPCEPFEVSIPFKRESVSQEHLF